MKFKLKKITGLLFCAASLVSSVYAKSTPVENLYEYNLENGLNVFVLENHNVPLVYVEIAVRTGGIDQTPETAGLFHLYEHMMFKANSLYKDAASVNKALSNLGVTNWNGSTGTDMVNYFFTIPSDKLEEGLEFWNAAIRTPTLKQSELDSEKKVVLSEIEGGLSDKGSLFSHYINYKMFPDAPYRTDAGGSLEAIENATVDHMKYIQSKFYIPSNAALFIGGDVNPEQTALLADKIFGTWSNNGNSIPQPQKQQQVSPLEKDTYSVLNYNKHPANLASVNLIFRGPDTDYNIEDTYAADYLSILLNDPSSYFYSFFAESEFLNVYGPDVWCGYRTVRGNGLYEFGATLKNPEENIFERSEFMLKNLREKVLPAIAENKALYSSAAKKKIVEKLYNEQISGSEIPSNLLSTIRFWWCCSSTEYYYTYIDKISKVTQQDVKKFISKYFSNNALVALIMNFPDEKNPLVLEENSKFSAEEITAENSLWWQNNKYSPDYSKSYLTDFSYTEDKLNKKENIFVEVKKAEFVSPEIKQFKLKNGIPVYVQKTSSHNVSVAAAVKGGVSLLTAETSGLESALFSTMSISSKKYSMEKIRALTYETGFGFSSSNKMTGSIFSINVLDKYLEKTIPVFADCFLNPDFSEKNMELIKNSVNQRVTSIKNDPETILSYSIKSELYKNHPYEVDTNVTLKSAENITKENLISHHQKNLNTENLFIIAVGNVDEKILLKKLNATFGKLKAAAKKVSADSEEFIPPVEILDEEDLILTHANSNGTAYAARVFASPSNLSQEFVTASMAAKIYSNILFNVVREKYGACYSPATYVIGSKAPYGMEYIYRLSDYENFKTYMDEARNYMAQGKVIEKLDENGKYVFSTIDENLESYKNAYINSSYHGSESSAGILVNLFYNIVQYKDLNHDAVLLNQVRNLTSEEILSVYKKYWIDGKSRWFIMKGE